MCRIEAFLNSRPLTALTDDPSDLDFLSSSNFLIQRSSFLAPEEDATNVNVQPGKRLFLIRQLSQHFWRRWSTDYLTALQPRQKWRQQHCPVAMGDLVLIRNELTPQIKWPLARATAIHPVMVSLAWSICARPTPFFVTPSPRSYNCTLQNEVYSPIRRRWAECLEFSVQTPDTAQWGFMTFFFSKLIAPLVMNKSGLFRS